MKTVLVLGLLTFVCMLVLISAGPLGPNFREGCCTTAGKVPIPPAKIKTVAMSPSHCKVKAIIITTVSEKKFCSDPTWDWTKKQLEIFQKSSNSSHTKL